MTTEQEQYINSGAAHSFAEYTIQIERRDPETGYDAINVYVYPVGDSRAIYEHHGENLAVAMAHVASAIVTQETRK